MHNADRLGHPLKGEPDDQGTLVWTDQQSRMHREGGPAFISFWCVRWYHHGKLHCVGGPAEIRANGTRLWYQHGKLHRDDGPAWERQDGSQSWFQTGRLHRDDGPARIRADGTVEWWLRGARLSEAEWRRRTA